MGRRQSFTVILATLLHLAIAQGAEPSRHEFEAKHMGTQFRIVVYSDPETAAKAAHAGFARVAELELVMSDYNPKSEIMLACLRNDEKPGQPIPVSDDLLRVLQASQATAKLSDGAFDVSVGPMTKLWRISRKTQQLPTAEDLIAAKKLVGYEKIRIDAKAKTMTLALPGMRLDFGGIGKGFAADEVLKLLKDKFGIRSALVAAAGDITVGDPPPGQPGWAIDIAPLRKVQPRRRLILANASVSTSGDLEQVAVIDGVRYSHIVNPKTGLGLTGRRSATIIAPTGTQADSLTKLASVLPESEAMKLLETLPGVATSITVQLDDAQPEHTVQTKGFARFLAKP